MVICESRRRIQGGVSIVGAACATIFAMTPEPGTKRLLLALLVTVLALAPARASAVIKSKAPPKPPTQAVKKPKPPPASAYPRPPKPISDPIDKLIKH